MQFHFMRHFSCFSLFTCFQLSPPSFPHFSGRIEVTCWIHNLSTLVFTYLLIRFFKLYRELLDCFHFSSPSTATTKYKAILRECFIPPLGNPYVSPFPLVSWNCFPIALLFMHFTFFIMHNQLCTVFSCKNSKNPCIFRFLFFFVRGCTSQKIIQKTLQIHIFV